MYNNETKERDIMKRLASLFILIAGTLWGIMGIFVRRLEAAGFDSIQIASMRIIGGALLFILTCALIDRKKLRIHIRDLGWFAGMGILSILMFTVCYFKTISIASLSVAAILLYTAPIMVMLMSLVLFKEKLTQKKIAALLMAFAGCVLVAGIGRNAGISPAAVVIGLLSGFGYGLYSIFGTYVVKKYSALTVTAYTFLFGSIGAVFVCRPSEIVSIINGSEKKAQICILILCTVFFTAFLPYLFYTIGLTYIKASSASIMASVEPVVASIAGVVVFHEKMTPMSLAGIILVLGAIILLNTQSKVTEPAVL